MGSSYRVVFFPGGGAFADLIRKYRSEHGLSDSVTHKMALASLDQNALMISDICQCRCVHTPEEINSCDSPVVIAPYRFLAEAELFSGFDLNIDKFSSTSSALVFAHLVSAHFIIATDVDGIFSADPNIEPKSELFNEISTARLKMIDRGGALDVSVPLLLEKFSMSAFVANGMFPDRISGAILKGPHQVKGTRIYPENTA